MARLSASQPPTSTAHVLGTSVLGAPALAATGVAIPVLIGIARGETPSAIAWLGLAVAAVFGVVLERDVS